MPGRKKSDFMVGQWVAINKDFYPAQPSWEIYTKVMRVVNVSEFEIQADHYLKANARDRGTFPLGGVLTADEMEETLYHCSYCGKEGHNRRTCPELGTGESVGKEEVISFDIGNPVSDPRTLKSGTMIMVENIDDDMDNPMASNFEAALYEVQEYSDRLDCVVVKTIEDGGHENVGPFGKTWNFSPESWAFYYAEVQTKGARVVLKEMKTWELIEIVLPASRLTLLYGPPGTGKTTAANFLGNPNEVYNLTLTEETPAAELRGHFIPKGSEFVWMDGPALTAFKKGARLVLNEIDKASGDALTFCHALLDDPGIARITLPYKDENGESVTVKPDPGFHVVATMNGEPDDLPEALRDRFAVRIEVEEVHPNAIVSLPEDIRKSAAKGISKDGGRSVSVRGWNAFVQLRDLVGEENAARAVFGDRAQTILNTIKIDSVKGSK